MYGNKVDYTMSRSLLGKVPQSKTHRDNLLRSPLHIARKACHLPAHMYHQVINIDHHFVVVNIESIDLLSTCPLVQTVAQCLQYITKTLTIQEAHLGCQSEP